MTDALILLAIFAISLAGSLVVNVGQAKQNADLRKDLAQARKNDARDDATGRFIKA